MNPTILPLTKDDSSPVSKPVKPITIKPPAGEASGRGVALFDFKKRNVDEIDLFASEVVSEQRDIRVCFPVYRFTVDGRRSS